MRRYLNRCHWGESEVGKLKRGSWKYPATQMNQIHFLCQKRYQCFLHPNRTQILRRITLFNNADEVKETSAIPITRNKETFASGFYARKIQPV